MNQAFMLTNRNWDGKQFGIERDAMRYFVCAAKQQKALCQAKNWQAVEQVDFVTALTGCASSFPVLPEAQNEQQKHVTLFVHGYNMSWEDTVQRYADLRARLYSGANNLGVLVLYSWPSDGFVMNYMPDREDARSSAPQLSDHLVYLHDYLIKQQRAAAITHDPEKFCRAKFSVIAHSMGNYVVQHALAIASKKLNNPQLVTLIHQLLMVAADVDNDLFQKNKPIDSDGALMANLCYRIAALYSGLDQVLGASAGLKHFGVRRLGRSGLAERGDVYDNVFDVDISPLLSNESEIHSGAFTSTRALRLLAEILRGRDRHQLTLQ